MRTSRTAARARIARRSPSSAPAVDHFNSRPLDFCVNLGDTIDREWRSYDAILAPLAASRHRWEHVFGNHDFALLDGEKTRGRRPPRHRRAPPLFRPARLPFRRPGHRRR
jgi:hypothetical protein